jgi:hypothetical protein
MDTADRANLAGRTALMLNPRFIGAVFSAFVLIPSIIGLFGGDVLVVLRAWKWRNAVPVKAGITSHTVTLISGNPNVFAEYEHALSYSFTADGQEFEYAGIFSSHRKEMIDFLGVEPILDPSKPLWVYYVPGNPDEHLMRMDPRPLFWKSATRLGFVAGFAIISTAIVVLLILFYRPNRRNPRRFAQRVEIPMAIDP